MSPGHKQPIVGRFFEVFANKILGGKLSRNNDSDLYLEATKTESLEIGVEVKSSGSSSSYGFRLATKQIKKYSELCNFPFDTVWYSFFKYQNLVKRIGERRETSLSYHENDSEIYKYLARNATHCHILGFEIIRALKSNVLTSNRSIMGHYGEETIDLKCRFVESFSGVEWKTKLEEVGIDPRKFEKYDGTIQTKIRIEDEMGIWHKHKVCLKIIAILPKKEVEVLKQKLKTHKGFKAEI